MALFRSHPSAFRWGFFCMGLLLLFLLQACGDGSPAYRQVELRGATMGTFYSIKLVDPPGDVAALGKGVQAVLDAVDEALSTYRPESDLSRFNNSRSTAWQSCSPEMVTVLARALKISRLTGGAFDVTVGPLVNLWGFGPDFVPERIPAPADLKAARARVGYQHLAVRSDPPGCRKDLADLYLDLSAIAKGYGVDRLAAYLDVQGLENYLVEVGGEVRAHGHSARGGPWGVAIERPDPGRREPFAVVEIHDGSLATSGDYRNFFERDGRRYSHTMDPQTGAPVTHNLASVTVIADSDMTADALATGLLVLGPEKGMALARELDLAALFIEHRGKGLERTATPGFGRYLVGP